MILNPYNKQSPILTIGKGPECDIVIDSKYVSTRHAQLTKSDGRWWLQDLGSKNGTRLNNRKIVSDPVPVTMRDVVSFGPVSIAVAELIRKLRPNCSSNLDQQAVPRGQSYIIGRAKEADIRLGITSISRKHARLTRAADDLWVIEDLGSRHGTFVGPNRSRLQTPMSLSPCDRIYLGSYGIKIDKLIKKIKEKKEGLKADVTVRAARGESLIVGRDPKAHIHLNYPQISWRHTRIIPFGDQQWIVEDLGSRNGTFVNGKRIGKQTVHFKDKISLGPYQLDITIDNQVVARDLTGDIRLDSIGGCLDIVVGGLKKRLLNDMSFTVFPSEFVGLMGLSGAGKTTLLMSLLGYKCYSQGNVQINGVDVYAHYDQFKSLVGYVPQDDILHGELDVEEALMFAARLRLPSDMSRDEIRQRVYNILECLGLFCPKKNVDVRNVPVNASGRKGISGGQRKRVNLAMELITEPPILFLDEPTSGLSSVDTLSVMGLLRELADQGKTIILTLHQPDIESFRKLDNALILDHGEMVYYGPTWPDSLIFFNPGVPAEEIVQRPESGLVGLSKHDTEYWKKRYGQSEIRKQYVEDRKDCDRFMADADAQKRELSCGIFNFHQWMILVQRNFMLKFKDRINTMILLLQAPIIGFLLGFIFYQQEEIINLPLYMLAISALWLGTSNAIREIVSEQSIYLRERMVGVGIPEYVLSKFAVLACLSVVQCILLIGMTNIFIGIRAGFAGIFGVLLLAAWVGCGLGLLLSSLVRSQAAAQALVPLSILPMVLLGGGIVSLPQIKLDVAKVVTYTMPSRWAYEALVQLESPEWNDHDAALLQKEYEELKRLARMLANPSVNLSFSALSVGGSLMVRIEGCDKTDLDDIEDTLELPERGYMVERLFKGHMAGVLGCCCVLGVYLFVLLLSVGIVQKNKDII